MQKIYSLLRNNKQSGPFNLEELLQLKLKPFDLIWVEGKGGGWSYPTEIDTLKNYVAEKPLVAEEKEAKGMPQSLILNTPIVTATTIETKARGANAQLTTPKYVYVSLPAGTKISAITPVSILPAELIDEETPEAKLERKALELRNKIQAFTVNKNQPKAVNDLDTKYTRSLDDIKDEYSSWLHQQQKKKTVLSKKSGLVVAGIAFLLVAGYFISQFLSSKTTDTHVLTAQETAGSTPVLDEPKKIEPAIVKLKPDKKGAAKAKKIRPISVSQTIRSNAPKNEIEKTDSYLDSLRSIENKKKQLPVEDVVYEPSSTTPAGERQRAMRNDASTAKKQIAKKETDAAPITELIKLSESTGSGTPHLSLYNNSNKHINFVAIDVSYYKDNQKLLQKKTLYFKDISPNSSAKLFLPQQKNAASVRYEMGLISTDDGLYYAKQ